jgi:hypothetical protein
VKNVAIKRRILILGIPKKDGVERNFLITLQDAFIVLPDETFSSIIKLKLNIFSINICDKLRPILTLHKNIVKAK